LRIRELYTGSGDAAGVLTSSALVLVMTPSLAFPLRKVAGLVAITPASGSLLRPAQVG
jgi:ammonia channel protein AmtB